MKNIFNYYFKAYDIISSIILFILPIFFYILGFINLLKQDYTTTIIGFLLGILWTPLIFIVTGVVRHNGLSSLPIDLSIYDFNQNSFYGDFKLTSEEAIRINKLFEKKLDEAKPSSNILQMVRELAIVHDLSSRLYLALIYRAVLEMGERKAKVEGSVEPNLKDKIVKLKMQLDSAKPKFPPKDDDDDESSGGKYNFL